MLKETNLEVLLLVGTTFGKRDAPNEKSHGRDKGFHEESKSCG